MKVSDIGEFGLIDLINKKNPITKNNVFMGIGDDAAVVKAPSEKYILMTTDTLVEDVHFSTKYATFFELGWKILAVNLSDIAAMGGTPKYALVTLGLKKSVSVADINEFYKGIRALAKKHRVEIVGGDIVSSPKSMFFTIDLYGVSGKCVKRSGARVGDLIISIGKMGGSSSAFADLKSKGRKAKSKERHLMPNPLINEGKRAAKYASSMIDNSDGLARCLIEICKASGRGARVYLERIPLDGDASLKDAFEGGEDYNLILTAPSRSAEKIRGGIVIGEIIKGRKILLINSKGIRKILKEKGYEHF